MELLHIVNGDSTRMGLERSGVPGAFVSWSDVLHDGPTPCGLSADEWRDVRTRHLATLGFPTGQVSAQYAKEDAALQTWPDYDEVVFWFEHDLYDQLILIRHLDWLSRVSDRGGTRFSLICRNTYLGPLAPDQFPPLFAERQPVSDEQIALGSRAWAAFCDPDPQALQPFAAAQSIALPFLAGALRRHLEDFPSSANGLARTEAQILETLADAPRSPYEAFTGTAHMEERIFMGDATFWAIVRRLASTRHPLLTLDVQPRVDRLPAGTMSLTDTGRRILEGSADHVALNGIDRWMGGAHLTSAHYWRWTGQTLVNAEC